MKLPFVPKLDFGKVKTDYQGFENKEKYKLNLETSFPKWIIKKFYDLGIKRFNHGIDFEERLDDKNEIDVPLSFFSQSAGITSWEEMILRQNKKAFEAAEKKYCWNLLTKRITKAKIRRCGESYSLFLEVSGKKTG